MDARPPIPCHHLRILIVANHLNGKDTHVRGLKIFGAPGSASRVFESKHRLMLGSPKPVTLTQTSPLRAATERKKGMTGKQLLELGHDGLSDFTSQKLKMHEFIR